MTKNIFTLISTLLIPLLALVVSAKAYGQYHILPIINDDCENVSSVFYEGDLVVAVDQTIYLIVSDNQFFELKSDLALSEYNGRHVVIEGIKLVHKLQPIEKVATASTFEKSAELLIVLNIRELTE